MSDKLRVVHYINQFYAGVGGEEKADIGPVLLEGQAKGPGMAIQGKFKDDLEIVATVYCGDSYFGENLEKATEEILGMISQFEPDLVITGPAFNAGRYGMAAGGVAKAVKEQLGIPVVTGMYEENPGADMYKKDVYIVATANSAVGMNDAIEKMVPLGIKLAKGEEIGGPEEEGYHERGIRVNYFTEKTGAARAADMLIKKLRGEEFVTEYPMPEFDNVEPNPPIKDLSTATIAIVSSGGPVPFGNPDRIESSSASRYGKYSIEGVDDLVKGEWQTAHGGFDATYADADMDRVIPVDVLRNYEKEGKIGKLHNFFYSTVGNGTSVANSKKFGEEIAQDLKEYGVDAVILTST